MTEKKFKVEYYNQFSEMKALTITANTPEAAISRARSRPDFDKYICVTLKKETETMTTTPAPSNDRITAEELRRAFEQINARIDALTETLTTITQGIAHAATATPPAAPAGQFAEMMIDNIIMTYDDKGKPAYKATGTPYNKFGVRVWDEVLPALGIDPAALRPGPNPQTPIRARVLLKANDEGKLNPQKVTGKA